ncbi:MAG: aminotransferase class III-fold pyridoxal phosphate-dependent enzyme [Spirochaetales bacterium]|jgi:taurine--2-oxoglutarate transaminase|nr:aminotransferase class III-fold pyridoxal phosphate-dependent enzyme [Spirochaetales bacterium]
MSGEVVKATDKKYNLHSWSAQGSLNPLVIEKSEGIYFWDSNGKKYYDMSAQLVNMNLGHQHKKIVEAIKAQADKMCYMGPGFAVDVRSELARKIIEEVAPPNMGKVFFTLAGAEANENAIKIAKMFTGRHKIFSRYRSYHGATYGSANLTGEPRRFPSEPGIPGFVKFFDPYIYREPVIKFASEEEASAYYLAKLEEQIIYEGRDKVAAIFLESVTGSNGVIIPPKGYLKGVRELCTKYGILMVCDEVMAGWGRTGEWFAFMNWGIEPDIITFAKGITCGYAPLGGVIISKKIAEHFDKNVLYCGLTYSAHPLGCAAGIAAIDVYKQEKIFDHVKEMGKVMAKRLAALRAAHDTVGECRSIGLFGMVEFVKNSKTDEPLVAYGQDPQGVMKQIMGKLAENGFWTYTHENMVAVSPPLIITEAELNQAFDILDKVAGWVDATFGEK